MGRSTGSLRFLKDLEEFFNILENPSGSLTTLRAPWALGHLGSMDGGLRILKNPKESLRIIGDPWTLGIHGWEH